MQLDYTITRIFQEMSLTEFETLHQLFELESTQVLESLALAVLKIPYAGPLLSGNRSIFLTTKETCYGITLVPKKCHLYMFLKTNDTIRESRFSTKTKYISLIHSPEEFVFEKQQSHVDQKIATMLYN